MFFLVVFSIPRWALNDCMFSKTLACSLGLSLEKSLKEKDLKQVNRKGWGQQYSIYAERRSESECVWKKQSGSLPCDTILTLPDMIYEVKAQPSLLLEGTLGSDGITPSI